MDDATPRAAAPLPPLSKQDLADAVGAAVRDGIKASKLDVDGSILPPSPDELAMLFAQANIMAGKHVNSEAAIHAAWASVPAFYMARQQYAQTAGVQWFTREDDKI